MNKFTFLIGLILLIGFSSAWGAELEVEEDYPVLGEGVKIYLTGQADPQNAKLFVIYRPNSATTIEKEIGSFKADGSLTWKPEAPGITKLIAKGADGKEIKNKSIATRFPSTPASGVTVMILAGILLFGGAGYSLKNALRE